MKKQMKSLNKISILTLLVLTLMAGLTGCKIDEEVFPNDPTLDGITDGATLSELQNLVSGIEAGSRNRLGTYGDAVGVPGREFYRFSGSDPRFTSDLLGKGAATLDNNTFYLTNPYYERYRVVRNCYILLTAVENTSATLTDEEKNGFRAYAHTMMGYSLLLNLNMMYQNGIRLDVEDPDNLGPFLSYDASLAGIMSLLDMADTELASAGTEFSFPLSSGFAGFDAPDGFRQFNRGVAARVALYQLDNTLALSLLTNSFMDMAGDMNTGVYHTFSSAGGDATNPLFFAQDATGELRVAHPSYVTDIEAGDLRISKVSMRTDTAFQDDLTSTYDVWVYTSLESSIGLVRNEELILISAEANAKAGNSGAAVTAIDAIRTAAGLPAYSGGMTEAELIDEVLVQRRYSLFGEGHRWVDMRRNDKLSELPIDRVDDDVWTQYPIPAAENE